MASIIKDVVVNANASVVWGALADFGALHERLVPGFVTETQLPTPDTRVVTFFNGSVVTEKLVGVDPDARRLAYTIVDGPLATTHHSASAQVFTADAGRCRFVWITDVLPDETGPVIAEMMDRGIASLKETFDAQPTPPSSPV